MASLRIRDNAIKFLEKKLQLTVNKEKTKAGRAEGAKILGFVFQTRGKKIDDSILQLGKCVPREKSLDKLKARIREITKRNRGVSLERVIKELNSLLRGWINYYARSSIKIKLKHIMEWTRRRVRQYAYKIWKTSKNRKHQLRLLGTEEWKLKKSFLSSRSYWKMSQSICKIFTNDMLHEKLKLVDGLTLYVEKHEEAKEKDKNIIYFDFLAKRMADEEEGFELLKEDWLFFNIERYV
jgi:hypothetical protein